MIRIIFSLVLLISLGDVNADINVKGNVEGDACEAHHGGKCDQRKHYSTVNVDHADYVCQAEDSGECWQGSDGESYKKCKKNRNGGYDCRK